MTTPTDSPAYGRATRTFAMRAMWAASDAFQRSPCLRREARLQRACEVRRRSLKEG